jgi:hypothetical protein
MLSELLAIACAVMAGLICSVVMSDSYNRRR